jgi:hypothetical protein
LVGNNSKPVSNSDKLNEIFENRGQACLCLSPAALARPGPPATPSSESELARARRRWTEVDLSLDVEATAWMLGAATERHSTWRRQHEQGVRWRRRCVPSFLQLYLNSPHVYRVEILCSWLPLLSRGPSPPAGPCTAMIAEVS